MSNRWQYLTIEIKPGLMGGINHETVQAELARQGQQGWELVSCVAPSPMKPLLLMFKKPA